MTEEEFLEHWRAERPGVEAWGRVVSEKLIEIINPLVEPLNADMFIRIPVKARIKNDGSLLTKAFYRNKEYDDPINDITDKVGVRIVVLLTSELRIVCEAIQGCESWNWSKDKDYEEEQQQKPYEFQYQSVHYVVRCKADMKIDGTHVKENSSCEIQVRTLLQHAHSELTHDTIYKPSVMQTPDMHRAAAKAMALVDVTTDYFEELAKLVEENITPSKALSLQMETLYFELVGVKADSTKAELLLNDAYERYGGDSPIDAIRKFSEQKPFIIEQVKKRSEEKLLFRQPSILLVYLAIDKEPAAAEQSWPLTPRELKPLFTDLGVAAPAD